MATTTIPLVFDARLSAYFFFTTLNTISTAVFEDPHNLLYGMVVWRAALLIWLVWLKQHGTATTVTSDACGGGGVYLSWFERLFLAVPVMATAVYFLGVKAPHNWESNFWSSLVDIFMSVYVLMGSSANDYTRTILHMFANFYTASGFWKINTHFLDPTASCATIFMAQLVTYYAGGFMSKSDISQVSLMLQPWFPVGTIAVEMTMGMGLLWASCFTIGSKGYYRVLLLAIILILGFHLAVCLMPRPHDISGFALQCASRLALVVPSGGWYKVGLACQRHILLLVTCSVFFLSYGIQHDFTPLNWDFGLFSFVSVLEVWAFVEAQGSVSSGDKATKETLQSTRQPWWTWFASSVAFFYSFGTIMLGLMEEASPNMFANLKIHGGSNHLILPTGLLFHWASARELQGDFDSFWVRNWGGGEIRLESTTSEWLTEIYPNDMTHVLQPQPLVVDLLQNDLDASRPAVYFNSGVNRVLHLRERGFIPPPPHGQFIPYTVPALEWKRLLREALSHKGRPSFEVEYVHLPGTTGDETWRAFAWDRRVTVRVADGKVVDCSVKQNVPDHIVATPCGPNEVPFQLDSVPYWLSKLGMYHGYPILYNADGSARKSISCFGP